VTGRPSTFTQETADAICTRLAEGETLRQICRDEAMPGLTTVFRWLEAYESFREQYARAREQQADTFAEKMHDEALNEARDVQRSKLIVDVLKWHAGKTAPKKYGERSTLDLANKDGQPFVINFLPADAKL
jgi:hypothetical protein